MADSKDGQFGQYERVRELDRSGASAIYTAKLAGEQGKPRFAVKSLELAGGLFDRAEMKARIGAFVARASVQKQVAEAAGARGHWAPILDDPQALGDRAFYVTNLYPVSAEALVGGRRDPLTAGEIWRLMTSVISGLLELQTALNRVHGNLKPGNVLVSGRRKQLRAYLSDPQHDEQSLRKDGIAGDMSKLGALIRGLVLHAMPAEGEILPEAMEPGWKSLGAEGEKWWSLSRRLMGTGDPVATFEELAAAVKVLKPAEERTSRMWIPITAAVAVVATVIAYKVAHYRAFDAGEYRQVCLQWDWYHAMTGDEVLEALRSDPAVYATVVELRTNEPNPADSPLDKNRRAAEQADEITDAARSQSAVHWTYETVLRMDKLHTALAPEHWPLRNRLTKALAPYEKLSPEPDFCKDLEAILAVIDKKPVNADQVSEIIHSRETFLNTLDAAQAEISFARKAAMAPNGAPDPVFLKVATLLQDVVDQGAFDRPDDVKALLQCSARLHDVTPDRYSRVRLRDNVSIPLASKFATFTRPAEWLGAVTQWHTDISGYQLLTAANDPRKAAAWNTVVNSTMTSELTELRSYGSDAALQADALEAQRKAMLANVADVTSREAVVLDLSTNVDGTGNFKDQVAALQSGIDALQVRIGQIESGFEIDPAKWRQETLAWRIGDGGAKGIEDLWERERTRNIGAGDVTKLPRTQFGDLRNNIKRLQSAVSTLASDSSTAPLLNIAALVGHKTPAWLDAMTALSGARREALLSSALNSARWDGKAWNPEFTGAWTDANKQWKDALADLQLLSGQTEAIEFLISDRGGMYRLAEAIPGGGVLRDKAEAWTTHMQTEADPVKAILKPSFDQIDALASLSRPNGIANDAAIARVDEPALVMSAWLAPNKLTLEAEDKVIPGLTSHIDNVADPVRKQALSDLLKNEIPKRWASRVSHPRDFVEMQLADKWESDWKLSDAALSEVGRYNMDLYRLRRDAADGKWTEADAQARADKFLQASKPLRSTAAVATALDGIDKLLTAARKAPKSTGAPGLLEGPAAKDWGQVAEGQPISYDLYDLKRPLVFEPIKFDDGQVVYLSTTDVWVGLFAQVLRDSKRLWSGAQEQMTALAMQNSTSSPHIWDLNWTPPRPPDLTARTEWVDTLPNFGGKKSYLPGPSDDPAPSDLSPMQFVSLDVARSFAAAMGCRLPTVAEWKAAYAIEKKSASKPTWNLRDQSWSADTAYVNPVIAQDLTGAVGASASPSNWTSPLFGDTTENLIWSGDLTRAVEGAAGAGSYGDGHLFFQKVAPPAPGSPDLAHWGNPGSKFYHIAGNVAQFVADADGAKAAYLIGGSAFSTPKAPLDVPVSVPPEQSATAWSDVGFRLAFPEPVVLVSKRLGPVLASATLLSE